MPEFYKEVPNHTDEQLRSLSICNSGRQKCVPHHLWGPGVRDHYLIHYIISGKGTFLTDHKIYHLEQGDAFVIYPDQEVYYCADDTEPWEYAWVGFTGTEAETILAATPFSKEQPTLHIYKNNTSIISYMDLIFNARGVELVHNIEMNGYLCLLLSLFIQEAQKQSRLSQSEAYVMISMDYIAANYSRALSVEDIANHVGISRSHLYRSFQDVIHKSPKEYLTEYRINQACYLLAHTNYSMKDIATTVGYENSLYFSKSFHKNIGMPPTEYAKREDIKHTPKTNI